VSPTRNRGPEAAGQGGCNTLTSLTFTTNRAGWNAKTFLPAGKEPRNDTSLIHPSGGLC
jgi:hypothetical protein